MPGGTPGFLFRRERSTGKVGDRSPNPDVLRVSAELLKAEGVIWPPKHIDASVTFGRLTPKQPP
jgi:hypothetical protein